MNRETLKFVEDAKDFFNKSNKHFTYRDKDDEHIALRYGLDGDCIKVYRLGEELELFEQWCNKAVKETSTKAKYEILNNSSTPYEVFEVTTTDHAYEDEGEDKRYTKKICVQMNGVDSAIASRDTDLIYIYVKDDDNRTTGESMSISQAKDVIEALNACINHAEKVKNIKSR